MPERPPDSLSEGFAERHRRLPSQPGQLPRVEAVMRIVTRSRAVEVDQVIVQGLAGVLGDHGGELEVRHAVGSGDVVPVRPPGVRIPGDRKSTRLNSSHTVISYAVFCLKKKN